MHITLISFPTCRPTSQFTPTYFGDHYASFTTLSIFCRSIALRLMPKPRHLMPLMLLVISCLRMIITSLLTYKKRWLNSPLIERVCKDVLLYSIFILYHAHNLICDENFLPVVFFNCLIYVGSALWSIFDLLSSHKNLSAAKVVKLYLVSC